MCIDNDIPDNSFVDYINDNGHGENESSNLHPLSVAS